MNAASRLVPLVRSLPLLLAVFALGACGHKKPKEAKSTAAPPAAAENKCEVKGFSYSMPEPGPIKDAKDVGAASDGGAQ